MKLCARILALRMRRHFAGWVLANGDFSLGRRDSLLILPSDTASRLLAACAARFLFTHCLRVDIQGSADIRMP